MPQPPMSPPPGRPKEGSLPSGDSAKREGVHQLNPTAGSGSLPSAVEDSLEATVILPTPAGAIEKTGQTVAPGWFGKLPFLGDFASRRLPDSFIKPWDEWLQPGLAAARDAMGERWLDLYLTFPVWRFVIPAGLLGDANWIGVLLPSVDRVGRCFPLTICEPVQRSLLEDSGLIGIDARLETLANVGVQALDADSVEFLEQHLVALDGLYAAAPAPAGAVPRPIPLEAWLQRQRASTDPLPAAWPLAAPVNAMLADAASRFVVATLRDRALWWSPADGTGSGGALRLEPFPFSGRLLGRLIGTS